VIWHHIRKFYSVELAAAVAIAVAIAVKVKQDY